jgi:hypothetical protein
MRREKLNLNDWIARLAGLNEELESERQLPRRLMSLTARLGLKNWLVYRAMTLEPGLLSPSLPRLALVAKKPRRSKTEPRKTPPAQEPLT